MSEAPTSTDGSPGGMGAVLGVLVGAIAIAGVTAALRYSGIAGAVGVVTIGIVLALVVRVHSDVAGALVVMIALLMCVPARLRFGPLHAAGTVGSLVGIAAFLVWVYGRVVRRHWLARGPQPLRWAMGILLASVLASYVAMGFRPHTIAEGKGADRGLLITLSMIGIALLAADGIANRERLRTVIKTVVVCGTGVALLGMVQFETGVDFAARIRVPGLTYVATPYGNSGNGSATRSGFSRIVGTTTHPIEFSVLLVVVFGLALHLMFTTPRPQHRRWSWCALILGVTIPMTVSRTAVIGFVVLAVVLFPTWPRRRKINGLFVLAFGLVAVRFAVPGLIGTLQSLFTNSNGDPSRESRSAGLDYAMRLIVERPWFGRGFGTFLPEQYTFLDDQVLLTVVETGIVGLAAVLVVYATAGWMTREVRRLSTDDCDRDLAQTLLGCLLATLATAFTYDFFSFPTILMVAMLVAGLSGALYRIVRTDPEVQWLSARQSRRGQVRATV